MYDFPSNNNATWNKFNRNVMRKFKKKNEVVFIFFEKKVANFEPYYFILKYF